MSKINFIQKHGISVDTPNYSLNILMPKNNNTLDLINKLPIRQSKRFSLYN